MAYESINPFNEQILKSFREHSDDEIEQALAASDRAFRDDWRDRSFDARAAVLKKAVSILRNRRADYAKTVTLEMGKLLREAVAEVDDAADILEYFAENAATLLAPTEIKTRKGQATVHSAPIGVIFCIEPWNYPYYQLARVVGPNLMAGNTVVMKHAPGVPQCALAFESLLREAGAPAGAYANLFVSNNQAGRIIADERVRGVALTGSERAGVAVAAAAGKALKKSTMELGGSDAFIVLDDADLSEAVRLAVAGRMQNSGQACAGSKRFIVHERIADGFIEAFKTELGQLSAGDPMRDETTLAPLCSKEALERVLEQIKAAVAGGAKVLMGGDRLDRPGYFLAPTLLTNVAPSNPAFRQEFFAPVAMIFRVANEEEAVALANNSPYGLGGSVITTDAARGRRVAERMDTGMVFINSTVVSIPELPFGGVKHSGFGREMSDLGINEFVNKKLVLVD